MKRRTLLDTFACGFGILLAGCIAGNGTETPTPGTDTPYATVADGGPCPKDRWPVQLANRLDEAKTVAVTITDDGSTVLSGEFDVPPQSADDHVVEPGVEVVHEETYTVEVHLDGEHALTEEYEMGCGAFVILVEKDGTVGLYTMERMD